MDGLKTNSIEASPDLVVLDDLECSVTIIGPSDERTEELEATSSNDPFLSIRDLRTSDCVVNQEEDEAADSDNNNESEVNVEKEMATATNKHPSGVLIEDPHNISSPLLHAVLTEDPTKKSTETSAFTNIPFTKGVRKKRRKRFFSSNPANTVAYRTRMVTKANLAGKSGDGPKIVPKVPETERSMHVKPKPNVDSETLSLELNEYEVRAPRKRSSRKLVSDMPEPVKKDRFIDLERPGSVLNQISVKSILNKHTFDLLPPLHQYKLLQLLPKVDTVVGPDNLKMPSSSAFNNEFFAKACEEWKTRLMAGEFTPEQMQRNRQEAERDRGKIDPWKVKNFEPVWGEKTTGAQPSKAQKIQTTENSLQAPEVCNRSQKPEHSAISSISRGTLATHGQPIPEMPGSKKLSDSGEDTGEGLVSIHEKPGEGTEEMTNSDDGASETVRPLSRSNKRLHQDTADDKLPVDKKGRLSAEPCVSGDVGADFSTKLGDHVEETQLAEVLELSPDCTRSGVAVIAQQEVPATESKPEYESVTASATDEPNSEITAFTAQAQDLQENGPSVEELSTQARASSPRPDTCVGHGGATIVEVFTDSMRTMGQSIPDTAAMKQEAETRDVNSLESIVSSNWTAQRESSPQDGQMTFNSESDEIMSQSQGASVVKSAKKLEDQPTEGNPSVTETVEGSNGVVLERKVKVEETDLRPDVVIITSNDDVKVVKDISDKRFPGCEPFAPGSSMDLRASRESDKMLWSSANHTNSETCVVQVAANPSEGGVKVTTQETNSNDAPSSSVQANNSPTAMGLHRKARPKSKQGKLARTPSAPPGSVNLERSYQICQAVIQNSPNREHLQNQLVKPPPVLVNTNKVDASFATHLQQHGLSGAHLPVVSAPQLQRRGSTPALVQTTQLQSSHVQLLRPHQKLILTHISGSPASKPLGISAHPVLPQQHQPVNSAQLAGSIQPLPVLRTVQSAPPVVLQSGQARPILQPQSHAPAPGGSAAATVITSQQLAMLIQQQHRHVVPALLQHQQRSLSSSSNPGTPRSDGVDVARSQPQTFTCTSVNSIASRTYSSINSLPPHIKIISSQYLQRVPTTTISKSASIPSLNQVVRIPIQRAGPNRPLLSQDNVPIRAKIINSVGETLTIHRAPQVDFKINSPDTEASTNSAMAENMSEQKYVHSVGGFPTKVRLLRTDQMDNISRTSPHDPARNSNMGSSLAEFVTSQLAASNIRPISPIGLDHSYRQNVMASFVGSNSSSTGVARNEERGDSGPSSQQQSSSSAASFGGGSTPTHILQSFSNSCDYAASGLISTLMGTSSEQGDTSSVGVDSPYSFISEADLTSVAETVDIDLTSKTDAGGSQKPVNTVYFTSPSWENSCVSGVGGSASTSDPVLFVAPHYDMGTGYASSSKSFNSQPSTSCKLRESLPGAVNKVDVESKRGTLTQMTGRFESPAPPQTTPEGLRQQYIIVQATGSNGLPTSLAVPTSSLVLSSPMILDNQKRNHQNDAAGNVGGENHSHFQTSHFSASSCGAAGDVASTPPLSTGYHLQGGLNNGVMTIDPNKCPHTTIDTDVKILYASSGTSTGHGIAYVQTSAPSQGQYILNSFMTQVGATHFKTNPGKGPNVVTIPMGSTQLPLTRCPASQANIPMNNAQNIIHVHNNPALLSQQIGNRIVNIGLRPTQNTWNTGIVNVNVNQSPTLMAGTIPDTTQTRDGSPANQGQQQQQHLNMLNTASGPNVKVMHFGGNGKIVNAADIEGLAIVPKPSSRSASAAPRLEHIVLDKKGNCICDLRAMVMCRKCGVFCHDDCMGATNLCVTCMIR